MISKELSSVVPSPNYEILTPEQFFIEFSQLSERATHRVFAQTMYIENGWAFDTMADALACARARGLDARLNVDAYSYLVQDQQLSCMPIINSAKRQRHEASIAAKRAAISKLADQGVSVSVTNPPNFLNKFLPFAGRNHIKLGIVDDVAWIGGLSYRDDDLSKEDFMMRLTGQDVVATLVKIFEVSNYSDVREDLIHDLDLTKIITDCGRRGQSCIFDYAMQSILNAQESVRIISQYSVNGRMAGALALKAAMGIDVLSITSDNTTISEWFGSLMDKASRASNRLRGLDVPTVYSPTRVHAKGLLVDGGNPDRAVGMVGSHNLTRSGVLLGTQEIGYFSSEPGFIENLREYFARVEGAAVKNTLQAPSLNAAVEGKSI